METTVWDSPVTTGPSWCHSGGPGVTAQWGAAGFPPVIAVQVTDCKWGRRNKDLEDGTTSKLMAQLYIVGNPPSECPALQVYKKNGRSSFKQRLLPGCKSEKARHQGLSLSKGDYSLALRGYPCVCWTERWWFSYWPQLAARTLMVLYLLQHKSGGFQTCGSFHCKRCGVCDGPTHAYIYETM